MQTWKRSNVHAVNRTNGSKQNFFCGATAHLGSHCEVSISHIIRHTRAHARTHVRTHVRTRTHMYTRNITPLHEWSFVANTATNNSTRNEHHSFSEIRTRAPSNQAASDLQEVEILKAFALGKWHNRGTTPVFGYRDAAKARKTSVMIGGDPVEIRTRQIPNMPVPVAVRSKAWVCGQSLAGIMGSNPAGDMDVRLSWVLCVVK